ncbi:unnamed protein product [Oreochromis niloticus]|nr:unnamed protein product [Mustela putorius furo]
MLCDLTHQHKMCQSSISYIIVTVMRSLTCPHALLYIKRTERLCFVLIFSSCVFVCAEFLPEPNVIDSSLKSSTSPTTGIQLLLSNWSTQQLRPDTFTVNTLVYILFVLLMKETSEDLKCECVSAPHWLFLSDGNMNSCG